MAEKTTLARPYAQAVFDIAKKAGPDALKSWSEVLQMASVVISDPQLQGLIGDPRIGKEQLVELILGFWDGKLDEAPQNFIRLLAENRRLDIVPEIRDLYEEQRAEAEGTVQAQVVSAFELTSVQQWNIEAALQKRFGRKVEISNTVDQSLLGGVIIRAGDTVIDGSTRGQLANLTSALTR